MDNMSGLDMCLTVFLLVGVIILGIFVFIGLALLASEFIDWIKEKDVLDEIKHKLKSDYALNWGDSYITLDIDRGFYSESNIIYTKDMPFIDFEEFRNIYAINPTSWKLSKFAVCKDENEEFCFTFTFDDWKRYKRFVNNVKMELEKEISEQKKLLNKQSIEKLRRVVKKDIENSVNT